MRRVGRFGAVAAIVALGVAAGGVVLIRWGALAGGTRQETSKRDVVGVFPTGIAERVQSQVATLAGESVLDSVASLADGLMYYQPGSSFGGVIPSDIPLDPTVDTLALERVLSNRRFLKVCEDLGTTGAEEATALLNECIPLYLDLYKEKLESCLAWTAAGGTRQSGQEHADPYRELMGMRLRLLALALAAGNLQLTGTHAAILDITETALEQRQRFYHQGQLSESLRFNLLILRSLYNRQILGYALLKTSGDPTLAPDALAAMGKEVVIVQLTVFDAVRTPYDRRLMPGPVDYSKGVLAVEYLPPITDEEFDAIVAATVATGEEPTADEQ